MSSPHQATKGEAAEGRWLALRLSPNVTELFLQFPTMLGVSGTSWRGDTPSTGSGSQLFCINHHLESSEKPGFLVRAPERLHQEAWGRAWGPASLTSSQAVLVLWGVGGECGR